MNAQGRSASLNGTRRRKLLQGVETRRPPERELPLHTRLEALAAELDPTNIDELWVFPPLPKREVASEFLLVTGFHTESDAHRRVITAHLEPEFKDEEGIEFVWVQRVQEVGPVPCAWLEVLPDSLLGRLAEAGVPEVHAIGGRLEAWTEVVARFAQVASNGNGSGRAQGNGASLSSLTAR